MFQDGTLINVLKLISNISPLLANNEVELVEKIKRKCRLLVLMVSYWMRIFLDLRNETFIIQVAQSKSDKEAADFSELYRKLQSHVCLFYLRTLDEEVIF